MADAQRRDTADSIEIVGPPGIGKTRLLRELRERGPRGSRPAADGRASPATTPYVAVPRLLLRDAL